VVYTDDSKIAGRLTAASFRVRTFQFGEQSLKLADVRTLGPAGVAADDANAPHGPANLMAYANQFGKELVFRVTGTINGAAPGGGMAFPAGPGRGGWAMAATGAVWGTDAYTLDSDLSMAAVHAGVLQPGQTAALRVRITQSPAQFTGSIRNGVMSNQFQMFPAGAYEFVKK